MKKIIIYLMLLLALPVLLRAQYLGGNGRGDVSVSLTYVPLDLDIPVLFQPLNGAINLQININLKWFNTCGPNYRVQLSNNNLFASGVKLDTTLTDTMTFVSSLLNDTTYYWRVQSISPYDTSTWSSIWSFKTIVDTPDVPVLFQPLNNSSNITVSPSLYWNPSLRASFYTVEVSSDSNFSSIIYRDSSLADTSAQVGSLSYNTKYFWRVNARNIGGASAWSNKWYFTTTLATPVLISPLNNSVGNLINPIMQWNQVTGSSKYHLQISQNIQFTELVFNDSNISTIQQEASGLIQLTNYYWRVRARNIGGYGSFSNYWAFKTMGLPNIISIIYPQNYSVNIPINLSFHWSKGSDQTMVPFIKNELKREDKDNNLIISKYWFELVTDTANMAGLIRDTTLSDTTKFISNLSNYSYYYWRIKGKNELGWGNFTIWNKFRTVIQAPSIIALVQPPNNATDQNSTTTFVWNKEPISERYFIQVSTDSTFNIVSFSDSTNSGNDTIKTVSPLLYNTKYYWRVNGYNIGGFGTYSNVWNFYTFVSGVVQLLSPLNGSVNQALNPTLTWSPELTAIGYHLQVSLDTNFSSPLVNDSSITTTSKQINGLSLNTRYFWRVKTRSTTGTGPYSNKWFFVTQLPTPFIGTIGAGNGTINMSWSITPNSNIRSFRIYRNTYSPAATLVDSVPGTQSAYSNTGLINGLTYYFRVKAVNYFNGESDFSNERSAVPFNIPPVAAQLRDTTLFNEGRLLLRNLTFSSSGSYDPEGTIDSIHWYLNGGYVSNSANYSYNFPQGLNTVKLVVIDNNGAKDSSIAKVKRAVFVKQFAGPVYAGLSMTADSILYAIASGDKVYRMDTDGNIKYFLSVGGNILSSSSIAYDTSVFIGSTDNNLYAFSKNGTSLWPPLPLGGQLTATATVDSSSNRIFIGSANYNFQAINRTNGSIVWNFFADAPIKYSAVITNNRRLIFTTIKGTIYGFNIDNLTSTPVWVISSNNDTISTSPAIDNQGYFYVGTTSGKIKKISMLPSLPGIVVWESIIGGTINSSPVIDGNGKVYAGSSNGNLYRLNKSNGNIEWSFQSGSPINTTPAISQTGRIYFGNQAGEIFAIDSLRNVKWYYKDSTSIGAAVLYKNGTVYVGSYGGKVLAFFDGTEFNLNPMLNPAPMWGTYQGNNRRTGNQYDVITQQNLTLNLKIYLEGFWDGSTQVSDTTTVYLANTTTPFAFIDSAKVVLSTSGTYSVNFTKAPNASYYIVVNHRNHLETWSKLPQSFVTNVVVNYDFTTAANKAFGDNMKQVGSVWVLYGGDANRDGSVDALDLFIFIGQFGNSGYLSCDFNGDESVDALDVPILVANFGLGKAVPTLDGGNGQPGNINKGKVIEEIQKKYKLNGESDKKETFKKTEIKLN
ncbi:MAG: PQQ-binding-like beta-propeller repeat protein [Ignavibacteriae bacterium]|nr:PQQ-binding-like beta-propeller repeat protein [Ignavibacteriota bacterium]